MSNTALTPVSSSTSSSSGASHAHRPALKIAKSHTSELQAAAAAAAAQAVPMTQQLQQGHAAGKAGVHFATSLSHATAASAPVEPEPAAVAPEASTSPLADAAKSLFGDALSTYAGIHTFGLIS